MNQDNGRAVKDVGIMTFHMYSNPGTILQALALQEKIEQLGYHSELIQFDARVKEKKTHYLASHIKRIPIYIRNFHKYFIIKKEASRIAEKDKLSRQFRNEFLKTGKSYYFSQEELCNNPPHYDAYVVGSDQTWNPNVSNNPDAFYLSFVTDKKKCGTYAPSVAVKTLTFEQKQRVKKLLKDIDWLSCREKEGALLIQEATGKHVETVIDPTLLLSSQDWLKFEKEVNVASPYILQYFLGENEHHRRIVNEISKKTGLPVINISTTYLDLKKGNVLICDPGEFLWLIANASLVCTDSFHGTAISINMNSTFYSFEKHLSYDLKSENSRIYNLLSSLELDARLIDAVPNINELEMDYTKPNTILCQMRDFSEQYLRNMLEAITS